MMMKSEVFLHAATVKRLLVATRLAFEIWVINLVYRLSICELDSGIATFIFSVNRLLGCQL
jgi:hypothetical protein